ncbi:MAG: hypothetical protein AAGJ09_03100 [Pseudomonadota bacterium]
MGKIDKLRLNGHPQAAVKNHGGKRWDIKLVAQGLHIIKIVAAFSCLAGLLSACQALVESPPPVVEQAPEPTIVQAGPPEPVPPPPRAPVAAKPTPIPDKAVALNTPRPLEKPPVTTLTEDQIVGAESATLLSLFGEPESITSTAPSQTWFYASGPCRLFVQLFKDLDSGAYRALKYSIEGGTSERCLAQFEHLGSIHSKGSQPPDAPIAAAAEPSEG